ncbi:MAG: T9SS type A sorting domain-containing protein [Salibacteraceae bacterium]
MKVKFSLISALLLSALLGQAQTTFQLEYTPPNNSNLSSRMHRGIDVKDVGNGYVFNIFTYEPIAGTFASQTNQYLAKVDANGNPLWTRTTGLATGETAEKSSLGLSNNGELFCIGGYDGTEGTAMSRYSSNGSFVDGWFFNAPCTDSESSTEGIPLGNDDIIKLSDQCYVSSNPADLIRTSDNGFLIGGHANFRNSLLVGSTKISFPYFAKTLPDGSIDWIKVYDLGVIGQDGDEGRIVTSVAEISNTDIALSFRVIETSEGVTDRTELLFADASGNPGPASSGTWYLKRNDRTVTDHIKLESIPNGNLLGIMNQFSIEKENIVHNGIFELDPSELIHTIGAPAINAIVKSHFWTDEMGQTLQIADVYVTNDDHFMATGYRLFGPEQKKEPILMRINRDYEVVWAKAYRAANRSEGSNARGNAVSLASDGGWIITGDVNQDYANSTVLLIKTGPEGESECTIDIATFRHDLDVVAYFVNEIGNVIDATSTEPNFPFEGSFTYNQTNHCCTFELDIAGENYLPTHLCPGESYTYYLPAGTSYQVTRNGVLISSNNQFILDQDGFYQIEVVDSNGCLGRQEFDVYFHPDVFVSIVQPPIVCNYGDNSFQISASPAGGVWSGTGIVDPINGIFDPLMSPGYYQVTYTYTDANGCEHSASVYVNVISCRKAISNEASANPSELILFPNPAQSHEVNVGIQLMDEVPANLTIFNTAGQLVDQRTIRQSQTLSFPNLSPGVYWVHLEQGESSTKKKLVILH